MSRLISASFRPTSTPPAASTPRSSSRRRTWESRPPPFFDLGVVGYQVKVVVRSFRAISALYANSKSRTIDRPNEKEDKSICYQLRSLRAKYVRYHKQHQRAPTQQQENYARTGAYVGEAASSTQLLRTQQLQQQQHTSSSPAAAYVVLSRSAGQN